MASGIQWDDRWLRELHREALRRLRRAASHLQREIVVNISTPVTKVQGPNGVTVDETSRSKPGEPPHADTTRLRKSIEQEIDEGRLVARVGTNVEYAAHLEFGTSKMAPRPFLRSTLYQEQRTIKRILGGA